ncbi:MAG: LysR family transcriptional regulator [Alphaproteobacteria bacterium]
MDWDKLRVFKAVAEAGSFTHAGENLNLSQSAISRQISGLETSLGLTLFHRHARGLVLTEQGEMLFQTTSEVFDSLQKVQMQLTDSRVLPEGPLTITTVEFIASTWLAPQISSFKGLYPDIQLTMLLDDRVYDLNRRQADVALRLQKANHADLIEKHMTTIDFSLCASKSYLEKAGTPKTLNDFSKHIMIGYPQNMHTPFLKPNWIFNRLGIDVINNSNVILINSMHTRYTAVKNGTGISVLPRYIAHQDDDIEILFPDLNIPAVDMYFVYPQERRNSKRISVLKDFLFHHIEDKKFHE